MGYEGLSLNFDATGNIHTKAPTVEEGDDVAKAKSNASLRFMPTSMGSTKKPAKPKPVPNCNPSSITAISDSSTTAPSDSLPPPPASQPQAREQITGKKRPSTFEDWVARPDEQYDYRAFRPRYLSKKQKRELKKQQIQPKIFTQDSIYELKHPSLDYLNFAQSDMALVVNDMWQKRLNVAEMKQAKLDGTYERVASANSGPKSGPKGGVHAPMPDGKPTAAPQETRREEDASHADSMSDKDWEIIRQAEAERQRVLATANKSNLAEQNTEEQRAKVEAQKAMARSKIEQIKAQLAEKKIASIISSQKQSQPSPPQSSPPAAAPTEPPPHSATTSGAPVMYAAPAPPQQGAIISGAPVMYTQPKPKTDPKGKSKSDPRAQAPKIASFAARILEKQGWEEGKGLGAQGDGIRTAIIVEAQKRKKLPDAQGGGFATPANMGRIVGGQETKDEPADKEAMSRVMKISNMLTGLDVDEEISDNSLLQEIGDQMGFHGNVERLFIWRKEAGGEDDVFVKFSSPLSTLNALKATDQDEFAGNEMTARFWDEGKFERGEYGS